MDDFVLDDIREGIFAALTKLNDLEWILERVPGVGNGHALVWGIRADLDRTLGRV